MKKCFFMAVVAVVLMTQFADAGMFARMRARRASRTGRAAVAAPAPATPAPAAGTPAPAAAPTAPAAPPATK
jgi:hypothetical protein